MSRQGVAVHRLMFRFSLRDLLWLILVIAMALGWWTDRKLIERRHHREWEALYDENAMLRHEMDAN
jgi:hypothetical protein